MTRAAIVFAAVVLAVACLRHNDDSDAGLYTVVARNMVRDGTWFDLAYTPNVHAHYREHLPFGLWPSAVTIKLVGERGLPWLSALWSLLTVALVADLGRRLGQANTGALAGLVLGTTEQFILNGAGHHLDPPLVFFALLAAAPVLVASKRSVAAWVLVTVAATLAVLIKGPFGLVPLVGAAVARAVLERDLRWLPWGAAATLVALVPTAGFLLHEHGLGSDWWSGYVEAQLLASAVGTRNDGSTSLLFPLASIGTRFWPWLPFVALGLWQARRPDEHRSARLVALWLVLCLVALMLPSRKLWHHVLIVFPGLALLVALGLTPLIQRPGRALLAGGMVIALAVLAFVAFGPRGRAASCTDFAADLEALPANSVVLVGASPTAAHWREIAVIAAELRLTPWLIDGLAASTEGLPATAQLALVPETWPIPSAWKEVRTARGWRLLTR